MRASPSCETLASSLNCEQACRIHDRPNWEGKEIVSNDSPCSVQLLCTGLALQSLRRPPFSVPAVFAHLPRSRFTWPSKLPSAVGRLFFSGCSENPDDALLMRHGCSEEDLPPQPPWRATDDALLVASPSALHAAYICSSTEIRHLPGQPSLETLAALAFCELFRTLWDLVFCFSAFAVRSMSVNPFSPTCCKAPVYQLNRKRELVLARKMFLA